MSKQFGGGEILRACLEANAVDSMPYFYTLYLNGNIGGTATFTVQNGQLQTENDSSFLMTSIWGISSNSFIDQPEFVGIYDAAQLKQFVFGPTTYYATGATFYDPNVCFVGLLNDSLASCLTLPEYILWGPNSLIGCSWLGRNGDFPHAYRYLVLGGIKYHMKGT